MTNQISQISPREAGHVGSLHGSPYYLMCDSMPLPIAVDAGDPVALAWRDEWASIADEQAKQYCGFDGVNWRGGSESASPAPSDPDTTALYLAICCEPFGTQIFVDAAGNVHSVEASLSHRGLPDDWVYVTRADGDFDRSDWGICYNDQAGGFVVRDMSGVFGTDNEALQSAVECFGITAETHDELLALIESRRNEQVGDSITQEYYY